MFNSNLTRHKKAVPRLDPEREQGNEISQVTTYKWSPEEMKKYLDEQYGNHLKKPKERKRMTTEVSRDDYLRLRVEGLNRLQAGKALKLGPVNLRVKLQEWGIEDKNHEQQAIEQFKIVASAVFVDEVAVSTENQPSETQESTTVDSDSTKYPQPSVDNDDSVDKSVETRKPFERRVMVEMTLTEFVMKKSIEVLIDDAHQTAVTHGWHQEAVPFPVRLALIHSELSEALEADRKEHGSDKVAEELADVIIRTFDTAAAHQLDLAGALFRKMHKNREREWRHGGLKY